MAGALTYTSLDAVNLTTAEVYGQTLLELAKNDARIVGLSGDLAKSTKIRNDSLTSVSRSRTC